jgi:hypothetical protein
MLLVQYLAPWACTRPLPLRAHLPQNLHRRCHNVLSSMETSTDGVCRHRSTPAYAILLNDGTVARSSSGSPLTMKFYVCVFMSHTAAITVCVLLRHFLINNPTLKDRASRIYHVHAGRNSRHRNALRHIITLLQYKVGQNDTISGYYQHQRRHLAVTSANRPPHRSQTAFGTALGASWGAGRDNLHSAECTSHYLTTSYMLLYYRAPGVMQVMSTLSGDSMTLCHDASSYF